MAAEPARPPIAGPIHRRLRQLLGQLEGGIELVSVAAPAVLTVRQAEFLVQRCEQRGAQLRQLPGPNGLGLDGSAETAKAVDIATLGALAGLVGEGGDRHTHLLYKALLNCPVELATIAALVGERPVKLRELAGDWPLELVADDLRLPVRIRHGRLEIAAPGPAPPVPDWMCGPEGLLATAWLVQRLIGARQQRPAGRTLIVGAGMMGTIHAGVAAADGSCAAVLSASAASAQALASVHGAAAHSSPAEVAWAEIDRVVVATPASAHRAAAQAAIDRGKPVLVEKPLASTLADAQAMVACAQDAGVSLVYAENWAYQQVVSELAAVLPDARPAKITVRASWPSPYPADYAWPCGAGVLLDGSSHLFALLRAILGPLRPVAVSCRILAFGGPAGADTAAALSLIGPDGNRIELRLDWLAEQACVQLELDDAIVDLTGDRRLLAGDGTLISFPRSIGLLGPWTDSGIRAEHAALAGRRPIAASLTDALDDLEMIMAAYHSAGAELPCPLPFRGDPALTGLQTFQRAAGQVAESERLG